MRAHPSRLADGRRSRFRRLIVAAAVAAMTLTGGITGQISATPASAATNAIRSLPICTANSLPASDDSSSLQAQLPFAMNFFGVSHTSLYVNNNGNVTFTGPLSTFTPSSLTGATGNPMIAAYFADVDTRGSGSQQVTYGSSATQFCVNWVRVGYYNSQTDKLISAQLVITDISAVTGTPGDVSIELNYSDVQWETGSASGGVNGFGGISAAVGFTAGTGVAGTYSQFDGSMAPGSLIDGGTNALVASSRNSTELGRYVFEVGGAPVLQGSISGTVLDDANDPVSGSVEICPTDGSACTTATISNTGAYSAIGLPVGDYDVTATPAAGSGLQPVTQRTTVQAGASTTLDFALTRIPQGALDITVLDHQGDPVLGATATACITGTTDCAPALPAADAAGLISATGLTVGQYTISVSAPAGSRLKNGTATATVANGGHATATVELLPLTDRTITGTVVDQHGDPVKGATVTLSAVQHGTPAVLPSGSPLLGAGANPQTTGRTGAFAWTVADGDYRVSVRSTECAEQNVTPPKPSEPPTEQLPDTGAHPVHPLLPGGSLALIVAGAALLLLGGRSRVKALTTR